MCAYKQCRLPTQKPNTSNVNIINIDVKLIFFIQTYSIAPTIPIVPMLNIIGIALCFVLSAKSFFHNDIKNTAKTKSKQY